MRTTRKNASLSVGPDTRGTQTENSEIIFLVHDKGSCVDALVLPHVRRKPPGIHTLNHPFQAWETSVSCAVYQTLALCLTLCFRPTSSPANQSRWLL